MSNDPIVVTLRLTPTDANAFQAFLAEILPDTRKAKGCRFCKTYVGRDNAGDFLLLQEWDSPADQQAYMAWRESTGVLQKFLGHLAKPADVSIWTLDPA
ncbi:antibiotic biosynthesis monooxygenase family protein [Hyphomicrobium sp. LHD-15]|uniref:putative quinol monooxygenase n=1 Tax=Hyphomicrobium sp. LHD-15 TaxID=3072142 RepID=UPI00280CD946|nr:antibiotic biosynthesis monooxygenase family protein [Hyphomicrobium sp. LHD-15]MDQ8698461.1 antibiotic biosynthesis monooxygenase family protein [Hyphomicrobium sp. LHD-15]